MGPFSAVHSLPDEALALSNAPALSSCSHGKQGGFWGCRSNDWEITHCCFLSVPLSQGAGEGVCWHTAGPRERKLQGSGV